MDDLEREAGAVAGVLPVHEQLVDLLHELHTRHLLKQSKHLKLWWPHATLFYFLLYLFHI
jgi:hypothetical protein